ncbi:MAG: lysine--tRNA ligase [bacterium]|nr:lysine--tRNA ligase [bacterium]
MKELTEQEKVRRDKLEEIRKYTNPYPEKFERTNTILEARSLSDGTSDVSICGRIVFLRKMGKLSFVRIRDLESDIQIQMKADTTNESDYEFFKKLVDVGDFIGATGEIITTQTGEKTLLAKSLKFLGKALRPLPEKFHGLSDTEIKYRERYTDLISNEDSRKVFLGRSKFYSFLHKYLDGAGFLEVETPIIQTAVSGATAKPFFTHHNALDLDCNLRIAPECYLKECIAGGFDRVYEVAKCFRNEGMDPQHLQEFTQVEWYVAYWNYEDNIKFFTKFIKEALKSVVGTEVITYQGKTVDFSKDEWNRIDYCNELEKVLGFNALTITDADLLKDKIVEANLFTYNDLEDYKSVGQIIDYVYKKKIRENIVEPTVIYNYPAVLKPLARRNDEDQTRTDVFQVVACGTELCNAYSELVNPLQQRASFEDQLKAKEQGDDETMDLDEDYLTSMEQGMPPISGLGFGIDRLMMLMFDEPSVRDVVLFPLMKDKK